MYRPAEAMHWHINADRMGLEAYDGYPIVQKLGGVHEVFIE